MFLLGVLHAIACGDIGVTFLCDLSITAPGRPNAIWYLKIDSVEERGNKYSSALEDHPDHGFYVD
jgi:hypothetical protein